MFKSNKNPAIQINIKANSATAEIFFKKIYFAHCLI